MPNKKVIRKDKVKGHFTTLHHDIITDTRLSSSAFRVLVKILSDSDTNFDISVSGLSKSLGMDPDTIRRAFDNLCEHGYMRKTPLENKSGYFYTISEFHNLNTTNKVENSEKIDVESNYEENKNRMIDYVSSLGDYTQLENVLVEINSIIEKFLVDDELTQYHRPKIEIEKLITKTKKDIYRECFSITENRDKNIPESAVKEYSNWLKEIIFNSNSLDFNHRNKWLKVKSKHRVFKTDAETEAHDRAEQEYYDNH